MKLLTRIARTILAPWIWQKWCPYCGVVAISEWGVDLPLHDCPIFEARMIREFKGKRD